MPTELRSQLHSLRIWANAARHHDAARWRRDGPRSEGEASRLVAAVTEAIGALEVLVSPEAQPSASPLERTW